MSGSITYKNNTIASYGNNVSKQLNTAGKYMEDNVQIIDSTIIQSLSITPSASTQTYSNNIVGNFIEKQSTFRGAITKTLTHTLTVGNYYYYKASYGTEGQSMSGELPNVSTGTFQCTSTLTTITTSFFAISSTQIQFLSSDQDVYQVELYEVTIVDGYAPVTVSGDANLIASNIKNGVTIFGVTGNYASGVLIEDSLDTNGGTIRTITTDTPLYIDTLNVTSNGQYTPTTNHYYSTVNVNVAGGSGMLLQDKTGIVPTESPQTITADSGYGALNSVQINGISPTYIGSGITARNSSSLSASGATVTVPAGYYASQATKSVSSGSSTAPATISGTSASLSTGTNTITLSKTISVTPTVTAGYVSSGTAGNSSVSLTASVTTLAAASYTPTTANITIASGAYLTGTQTILGDSNLVAGNIKSGVSIFGVNGSYTGSGGTPNLQAKTNINPTTSSQTIEPDSGYDGLSSVQINAMPTMTLPTAATSSATSGFTSKATISRSTSDQYINIPTGYNSAGAYYKISAVANGSSTAPASISGTSATVTTGTNTITLTKTVSVTPSVTAGYISSGTAGNSSVSLTASVTVNPTPTASGATVTIPAGYYSSQTTKSVTSGSATGPSSLSGSSATVSTGTNTLTLTKTGVTTTPTVSAGYVSSATASTATVTLTASVTTKAAATITPGTTNQTIASGTYLTGTQTISGDSNLVAGNIISGKTIFGVSGSVVIQHYYTGTSTPSSSLGADGDIYLKTT